MAFTPTKKTPRFTLKKMALFMAAVSLTIQSCKHEKKIYQSNCNSGLSYKRVNFKLLIDSIQNYDRQYIEVEGTYKEGDAKSALVSDSLFVDHSSKHALWVNFSQDCPLVLTGTNKGLFEFNDGKFTQINNKNIIIRGKIDVLQKGHLGSYRGSIDRISYIKL